jgi:hypothetical protein
MANFQKTDVAITTIPGIANAVLDSIEAMSEDSVMWVKPTAQGFMLGEETYESIDGVITDIDFYYCRWSNNQIDKIHDVLPGNEPEGYSPRADVLVFTSDGEEVGISLATSSFKFSLAPYLKNLKRMGLAPTQAVTKFTTKEVKGRMGTYVTVRMTLQGRADFAAQPISATVSDDGNIPF